MLSTKKTNPILMTAAFIVIIAGMMFARKIVSPLLLALFITAICVQPVRWLKSKKVPQGLAILIVFALIFGLFIGFGQLISSSLSSFSDNAALYEKNLNEMKAALFQFLESRGIQIPDTDLSGTMVPGKIMSFTRDILRQLGEFMGNAFTIFFLVLFLLMEMESLNIKSKAITQSNAEPPAFIRKIADSIRHYLSIKTMTSFITGFLIWICLAVIGVEYSIIWALIAFLLNYIPNIGSILAAVPAVLFAMIQLGLGGVISTTVVFVVVNMVVGNVIEPKMMGKGMGLSTFVVFFSLVFWGFVLGTVGMFLSVPLTMALKIILEQNPETKGIAIFLGTQAEAQHICEENQVVINPKSN